MIATMAAISKPVRAWGLCDGGAGVAAVMIRLSHGAGLASAHFE
jgi:hypothetical protein